LDGAVGSRQKTFKVFSMTFVTAAFNISPNRILDFVKWNMGLFVEYKINVAIVTDRDIDGINCGQVETIVYPVKQSFFSLPKTLNYGIRRVSDDIIVKTDIDIVFSDKIILYLLETIKSGVGVSALYGRVRSFESISDVVNNWDVIKKHTNGNGACFALHKDDWYGLCGYNENLYGWGYDDTDMYSRARKRLKMIRTSSYPLYHIEHPRRSSNKDGAFFKSNNDLNRKIANAVVWNGDGWGIVA
jgi:hypothetical protein